MTVTTHIESAQSRVRAEREAVERKREAVETFAERVADLSTDPTPSAAAGVTATAGPRRHGESGAADRCRTVRTAFAETIRPHSLDDTDDSEPLLSTIRAELTDGIAVALAPTTDVPFSAELKKAIVAETHARRVEAETLVAALDRERSALGDAASTVEAVTGRLADADETPLTDLGFDALRTRHETLATHRDRCQALADRRQTFLDESTASNSRAGISHRTLVPYLYADFPVDHTVLSTVARLDAVCLNAQRAVRDHLVRRA
ncbi:hypothetical protein DU500_14025 [Haloplanus rubicundus]|uniref:DUF7260 domain-containing protein n=1 Tax=Haloplanus rubicundus TaxID=1547898 RepID=A0A345E5I0_9EURY|nr:hypothetical protein [Haloplanus rubicundus]AXG07452.1 hypothetical protein DU500_14025 [Haloplanus rubicundus]